MFSCSPIIYLESNVIRIVYTVHTGIMVAIQEALIQLSDYTIFSPFLIDAYLSVGFMAVYESKIQFPRLKGVRKCQDWMTERKLAIGVCIWAWTRKH